MPFDSAGTFTRVHNWEQDRLDGISIDSARVDEEMDDVASGLSKCMLRAGGQAMLNNLNMNSFKIQNVANGTAEADAVNKSQLDAQNTALTTAYQNYVKTVLGQIYPVGSVYIGTQNTCPMAALIAGSTWTLVSSGRALWTGTGSNANSTIDAGLPAHTHTITFTSLRHGKDGAGNVGDNSLANGDSYTGSVSHIVTSAGASNSIYGKSSTVQPPAYVVNVWRRTK